MSEDHSMTCPSNRCKPGSKLLGIRQQNGTVAIFPEPLAIDDAFIEKVKAHPTPPEQRFRFANKCIENGCNQWTGKGCGVIEQVVQYLDQVTPNELLPACSIRVKCRWFSQKGAEACKICPYVITEITEKEMAYFPPI